MGSAWANGIRPGHKRHAASGSSDPGVSDWVALAGVSQLAGSDTKPDHGRRCGNPPGAAHVNPGLDMEHDEFDVCAFVAWDGCRFRNSYATGDATASGRSAFCPADHRAGASAGRLDDGGGFRLRS